FRNIRMCSPTVQASSGSKPNPWVLTSRVHACRSTAAPLTPIRHRTRKLSRYRRATRLSGPLDGVISAPAFRVVMLVLMVEPDNALAPPILNRLFYRGNAAHA